MEASHKITESFLNHLGILQLIRQQVYLHQLIKKIKLTENFEAKIDLSVELKL